MWQANQQPKAGLRFPGEEHLQYNFVGASLSPSKSNQQWQNFHFGM